MALSSRPFGFGVVGALALILSACASELIEPASVSIDPATISPHDTDKLLVVDCVLPGRVRKLGQSLTYLEPRRPTKTSALDCEIRGGDYVAYDRADYRTALNVWLEGAEAGDPEAQTYVGEIYEKGFGVEPNYVLALEWYYKAADQGYSRAQINLGYLYEKGLGVEQDLTEALNWYRKSSGLTEDIDFASSIDLGSQDKELEKLREDVTRLQHEADDARTKLSDAQSKLSGVQKDKQALEKELQRLQRLKTIFDEDPSSPEISNLDREQVERQLQDRQLELNERSDEADVLVQQTEDYRGELDELESAQQEAKIGPRIELIEPALTVAATRGTPAVRLRSPAEQTEIVGRVSAPAGLLTFNVNDQFEEVDQSGSFRVWVPVGNKETPVSLVAIDNKGRRTVIDFVITPPQLASAPAEPTPESTPIFPETGDIDFGSYHALVIGNDDYTRLPRLQTASKDARMVEATLREKYNFQTTLLLNADRHSILSALYQLGERMTEQDNLLIYYAGHGDLDRINDRGYWLPVNAEPGNAANWISNISITDLINTMTARHIMVIADSCYSGAMSRSAVPRVDVNMPPELREKWLRLMTKNKSRTVLTSGGLQPVLDEGGGTNSVFAQAFLTALRENDQIIEGYSVFRQISQTVTEKAAQLGIEQVPEYAPIKHAGHETGQFFFVPAA